MKKHLAYLGMLSATIIWGLNFVMLKIALGQYPVLPFLFFRFLLGATFLFALAQTHPHWREGWRQAPRRSIAWLSLIVAFGYIASAAGLALGVSAGLAAMINALILITTPSLVWLHGGHRPNLRFGISIALALGAVLLVAIPSLGHLNPLMLLGIGLEGISLVAFSLQIIIIERIMKSVDAIALAGSQLMMLALLFGGLTLISRTFKPLTVSEIIIIALSGLGASAIGFALQAIAQKHIDSTSIAAINALEPGFAIVFSAVLIGTRISVLDGMAILGLGLAATMETSAMRMFCSLIVQALRDFLQMSSVYRYIMEQQSLLGESD